MRILAALFVFLGFSACSTTPANEPCPTPQACQLSQIMATLLEPDVGTDFGGGIILRDVQPAGALVVVDMQVPLPGQGMEDVQKRAIHQLTASSFAAGFCEDRSVDLFEFGNSYQVRSFGNDGVILGASTLRSCGA